MAARTSLSRYPSVLPSHSAGQVAVAQPEWATHRSQIKSPGCPPFDEGKDIVSSRCQVKGICRRSGTKPKEHFQSSALHKDRHTSEDCYSHDEIATDIISINTGTDRDMKRTEQDPQHPAGWAGGDEWDEHRDAIQELYQVKNLPLKDVMKAMEDKYGFRATQRMYKTRIKSWGLDKNFKESEVVELFRLRRERELAGKGHGTIYTIRGREVDWDRVHSYIRRKGLDIHRLIDTAPISPSARAEISCRTPSPNAGTGTSRVRVQVASPSSVSASELSPLSTTCTISSTTDRTPPPLSVSSLMQPSPTFLFSTFSARSGPFLSPDSTSASVPSSMYSMQSAETLQIFQAFLKKSFEAVLYEDDERDWGRTEWWIRSERSLEWLMTLRYKVALHRDYLESRAQHAFRFRALNRCFAILQPAVTSTTGARLYYIIIFLYAFLPSGDQGSHPFASTALQLMDSICSSSATTVRRHSGPDAMEHHNFDDRMDISHPELRFGEGWDFQESAMEFLKSVLGSIVERLGFDRVHLDAILPLTNAPLQYTGQPRAQGQSSPTNATKALESALFLLSQGRDTQAEAILNELVAASTSLEDEESRKHLVEGLRPPVLPSRYVATPSSASSVVSSQALREARALARCGRYHLSRISRRGGGAGDEARAKNHLMRSVEGSILFDSLVSWDDVEFLFS